MNGAKTDGATLMHGALRVQPSDCGLFQVETGCNSGSICCPLKLGSLSIRESQTKPRSGEMFIACSARNGRQLRRSAMFSDTIHLASELHGSCLKPEFYKHFISTE